MLDTFDNSNPLNQVEMDPAESAPDNEQSLHRHIETDQENVAVSQMDAVDGPTQVNRDDPMISDLNDHQLVAPINRQQSIDQHQQQQPPTNEQPGQHSFSSSSWPGPSGGGADLANFQPHYVPNENRYVQQQQPPSNNAHHYHEMGNVVQMQHEDHESSSARPSAVVSMSYEMPAGDPYLAGYNLPSNFMPREQPDMMHQHHPSYDYTNWLPNYATTSDDSSIYNHHHRQNNHSYYSTASSQNYPINPIHETYNHHHSSSQSYADWCRLNSPINNDRTSYLTELHSALNDPMMQTIDHHQQQNQNLSTQPEPMCDYENNDVEKIDLYQLESSGSTMQNNQNIASCDNELSNEMSSSPWTGQQRGVIRRHNKLDQLFEEATIDTPKQASFMDETSHEIGSSTKINNPRSSVTTRSKQQKTSCLIKKQLDENFALTTSSDASGNASSIDESSSSQGSPQASSTFKCCECIIGGGPGAINCHDNNNNNNSNNQYQQATKCGATFTNLDEFVIHISEAHVRQDPEERGHFYCSWADCKRGKPFNARYKLLVHMRVHSGEKPFECMEKNCKKRFSRLENLKIHVRSHTGEKPYDCTFPGCSKAFTNSSDRIKHHKTHNDPKPYPCTEHGCKKRYTDPSSLRKHQKSHKRGFDGTSGNPNGLFVPSELQQKEDQAFASSAPISIDYQHHHHHSRTSLPMPPHEQYSDDILISNNYPTNNYHTSQTSFGTSLNHFQSDNQQHEFPMGQDNHVVCPADFDPNSLLQPNTLQQNYPNQTTTYFKNELICNSYDQQQTNQQHMNDTTSTNQQQSMYVPSINCRYQSSQDSDDQLINRIDNQLSQTWAGPSTNHQAGGAFIGSTSTGHTNQTNTTNFFHFHADNNAVQLPQPLIEINKDNSECCFATEADTLEYQAYVQTSGNTGANFISSPGDNNNTSYNPICNNNIEPSTSAATSSMHQQLMRSLPTPNTYRQHQRQQAPLRQISFPTSTPMSNNNYNMQIQSSMDHNHNQNHQHRNQDNHNNDRRWTTTTTTNPGNLGGHQPT